MFQNSQVTPLLAEEECEAEVGKYLNRLSDFLFTLARFLPSLSSEFCY